MKLLLIIAVAFVLLTPVSAIASPGRTDANGCHTEKATGKYHCHTKPAVKIARATARTAAPVAAKTSAKDRNCSDFTTHKEAQAVFEKNGGKDFDIFKLDADKDGIACEELLKRK